MKILKKVTHLAALTLMIGPIIGCGTINPYKKNPQGFYEKHYNCCGPVALEKAINRYYAKRGIVFAKNPAPRKEISQRIQSEGMAIKECLSFFNRDAICITWPDEIKKTAKKYGFDIVSVDDIKTLDPTKDLALVLIHGKFFSKQYHWVVYPLDDVENFYGKKTVIDLIYVLKWKGE
jgi:hypothetical protein